MLYPSQKATTAFFLFGTPPVWNLNYKFLPRFLTQINVGHRDLHDLFGTCTFGENNLSALEKCTTDQYTAWDMVRGWGSLEGWSKLLLRLLQLQQPQTLLKPSTSIWTATKGRKEDISKHCCMVVAIYELKELPLWFISEHLNFWRFLMQIVHTIFLLQVYIMFLTSTSDQYCLHTL